MIGVWHSGGAKLDEGVASMRRHRPDVRRDGARLRPDPQLSVVLGPAAGGAAYGPALTDLVIMSPNPAGFLSPDRTWCAAVTGEQIDMAGLGGAEAHGRKSGVVHVTTGSESEAYAEARRIIGFVGRPGRWTRRDHAAAQDLRALLPDSPRRAYDVKPLVRALLDDGDFAELQAKWAPNVVIGFGRLGGRTVGVIANNPLRKGGCLDSLSAEKASRFVRMCDSFGIPLLVLVDVPGYLPGVSQEWGGVVRRGAKLLHAFAEAVVPRSPWSPGSPTAARTSR